VFGGRIGRRPSIRASLVTIFLAVAIVFVGFSAMTSNLLATVNQGATQVNRHALPKILVSKDIRSEILALQAAYFMYITGTSPEITAQAAAEITTRQENAERLVEHAREIASSDKERELLDAIANTVQTFEQQSEGVLNLAKMSMYDMATAKLTELMEGAQPAFAAMVELTDIATASAGTAMQHAENSYEKARRLVLVMIAVALLGTLMAVVFVVRSIAMPIGRITRSMRNLADGDTANDIPFAGRSDEIGAMAGAVEIFRQAAIANQRLEQEAAENRSRAEAERIEAERQAEAAAAERLRVATTGLAEALQRLAAGDLAFQITEPFAPDFEPLRRDFNQSVRQLGGTLSEISFSISSLENGTHDISSGVDDLSKRTEHQAASLEETSAALEEITDKVNTSARRTEEARSIAAEANKSATKSAEVVRHAEQAMHRIEDGSQEISKIIGVIDQIAFQTNLLALNAGVEAARAGEAGKGFAVVAQEVRELAQRSAQAAKEIKDLIGRSVGEVEGGVKLVRDASEALSTIGGFIVDINAHMDAIAVSAREQATGIVEVNGAINSMDKATQQNAAMVEQSNAASASLANDARTLRALVEQFKLEANGSVQAGGQAGALRSAAAA